MNLLKEKELIPKKPKRFHVIGDCFNCHEDVEYLLTRKKENEEKDEDYGIIFLGNYFSKENHFLEMANYLVALKGVPQLNVVFLRGYNETLLCNYLEDIEGSFLDKRNTKILVSSIEKQLGYPFKQINKHFPKLYMLLMETKTWYDNDLYIFCPGSIRMNHAWKTTQPEEFFVSSNKYMLEGKNLTEKTIIFGHYPSSIFHSLYFKEKRTYDNCVWKSKDGTKYCLNGEGNREEGTGKILALYIDEKDIYSILARVGRKKPTLQGYIA